MSDSAAGGPPWLRKETLLTPEVIAQRERIARLGPAHRLRVGALPEPLRVLPGRQRDLPHPRRPLHARLRLLRHRSRPDRGPDPGEGERIASHMRAGGIRYAVITSVTRDDLPDGGAAHFASVVAAIRAALPDAGLELLVPDFRGDPAAIEVAVDLPIQVFAHNLETVQSLYPRARRGADYRRSLEVLGGPPPAAGTAPGSRRGSWSASASGGRSSSGSSRTPRARGSRSSPSASTCGRRGKTSRSSATSSPRSSRSSAPSRARAASPSCRRARTCAARTSRSVRLRTRSAPPALPPCRPPTFRTEKSV